LGREEIQAPPASPAPMPPKKKFESLVNLLSPQPPLFPKKPVFLPPIAREPGNRFSGKFY